MPFQSKKFDSSENAYLEFKFKQILIVTETLNRCYNENNVVCRIHIHDD